LAPGEVGVPLVGGLLPVVPVVPVVVPVVPVPVTPVVVPVLGGAVPAPVGVPAVPPVTPVVPVPVVPPHSGGKLGLTVVEVPGAAPGFALRVVVAVVLVALPDVSTPVVALGLLVVAEGVQVGLMPGSVAGGTFVGVWVPGCVCVAGPFTGPFSMAPVVPPVWPVATVPLVLVFPGTVTPVWAAVQAADATSKKLQHRTLFIVCYLP